MVAKKQKESSIMQVEFICPKCQKHLAWAVRTASMSCPQCGKWVTDKNRLHAEADALMPVDSDQLIGL